MRTNESMAAFVAASLLCLIAACSKPAAAVADAAPPVEAKPVLHLPAPFSDVKLGMTRADLEAKFPAGEDISHCEAQLVGGDRPEPVQVPGTEKRPKSLCARSFDMGGPTAHELERILSEATRIGGDDSAEIADGWMYTVAQVRGSLRAGTVTEAALLRADRLHSATAVGAVASVAESLFRGGLTFAKARKTRREVCAVIADSCDDVDPARLRKYVVGTMSLAQIDAEAHSRVANGKCRGPYLQHEKTLARTFARRAGALGGIGLARASRPDHQLKAEDASTFSVYSSRSELDAASAKLGVLVANGLPDAEKYWDGAVALLPGERGSTDWSRAIVWLRDGHVVRVLVDTLVEADKLGELATKVAAFYGVAGATKGTLTGWKLADGTSVTLDIGAAASLVVESGAAAAPAR